MASSTNEGFYSQFFKDSGEGKNRPLCALCETIVPCGLNPKKATTSNKKYHLDKHHHTKYEEAKLNHEDDIKLKESLRRKGSYSSDLQEPKQQKTLFQTWDKY